MKRNNGILSSRNLWHIVFAFTMLVYVVGLFIPIMEPDAAVYAQVSMEMHDRGDYLSIYHKGVDWLDKPHFPFWMSALSYEVFGVNAFAYKLPAVLFVLLGAFYTYLFGKRFYNSLVGWLAVIILITAEHIIISNQDVRAEPFMTGLLMMGMYHFAVLVSPRKGMNNITYGATANVVSEPPPNLISGASTVPSVILSRAKRSEGSTEEQLTPTSQLTHIVLASLATACLIMTKGLFTIIPIASGVLFTLLYYKRFKEIIHWRWLVVLVMVVIFMSPALYGYYQQFDKHPEKVVFGETNVSGVKFFLWTSQWGRFTNTGPIKGKGDITFFVHTMLWAFLPWAFAAFYALFRKTKQLIRKTNTSETFTYFGFITLFLIFSASKFQLSFYLNPLFPLLSIITSSMIVGASKKVLKTFSTMHLVVCMLLALGAVGLQYIFSATLPHIDTLIVFTLGAVLGFTVFFGSRSYVKKIIFATALVVLSVNYYLNRDFYPELLTYQAESEAAYFLKENKIPARDVVFIGEMESIADVIMHAPTKVISIDDVKVSDVSDKIVFTSTEGRAKINSLGLKYDIVEQFDDFPVTRLTGKFINKATRLQEVQTKYLLRVAPVDDTKPSVEVTGR